MAKIKAKPTGREHFSSALVLDDTLNTGHIDPRIVASFQSAWSLDTAYPPCKDAWLKAANDSKTTLISIGQCLVTADTLMDLYPKSGKILVNIDDPAQDALVPHYLFWRDAYLGCDPNNIASFRSAASGLVRDLAEGKLALQDSPLSDLTGTQFSKGSRIIFIDPLSEKYANDLISHLDGDRSFMPRKMLLRQRFEAAMQALCGHGSLAVMAEINKDRQWALSQDAVPRYFQDMPNHAVKSVIASHRGIV